MRLSQKNNSYTIVLFICLGISLFISSCATHNNTEKTPTFTPPTTLKPAHYRGNDFSLAAWQRITTPNHPIHIYIEGDGAAWKYNKAPKDPTPHNPIALKLAALDTAKNVIYLARPCQFISLTSPTTPHHCRQKDYWTTKRFAKEVIDNYLNILDQIAEQTHATGFHLIGFSGGANIAGLITARRDDVISLRTIAGNLDNDFFVSLHRVSSMPLSLNMANETSKLAHIPQYHFIGEDDHIVPIAVFNHFIQQFSNTSCIQHSVIHHATHNEGWEQQWPRLLRYPLNCRDRDGQ